MMQQLLQMALTLLIAAQSPNIPEDLRLQATQVAQTAIQYVNMTDEKQKAASAPVQNDEYGEQYTPDLTQKPSVSAPKPFK